MSETPKNTPSRREFLNTSGRIAAASALGLGAVPAVHAAENNTIKVALVGCGGRGTGAAINALSTKSGPTELVAMADVFDASAAVQSPEPLPASSASRSTFRRTASSSASTRTRRPSTAWTDRAW